MKSIPRPIANLIREFNKLPGIGSKSSERFVYFLLRQPKEELDAFAESLKKVKESIRLCKNCYTFSEEELCSICRDQTRSREVVCVVAEPKDVFAIENTGQFDGLYHVLGGVIDHVAGISPSQLRIGELIERAQRDAVKEIIIALNPDMEGETTALYIKRELQKHVPGMRITKIARGLPMGANIEYADEVTLGSALNGRRTME